MRPTDRPSHVQYYSGRTGQEGGLFVQDEAQRRLVDARGSGRRAGGRRPDGVARAASCCCRRRWLLRVDAHAQVAERAPVLPPASARPQVATVVHGPHATAKARRRADRSPAASAAPMPVGR